MPLNVPVSAKLDRATAEALDALGYPTRSEAVRAAIEALTGTAPARPERGRSRGEDLEILKALASLVVRDD